MLSNLSDSSGFQHTAARRWLLRTALAGGSFWICFNTQPPEGGCLRNIMIQHKKRLFQHTATRRWLQGRSSFLRFDESFNTQPPEGGCDKAHLASV